MDFFPHLYQIFALILVMHHASGSKMMCFKCKNIELVTRVEWGARAPREIQNLTTPVDQVFIHHTAQEQCEDKESCIRLMQGIQNFHMDIRNWSDIGYSFLVGGDGRLYEGRGWTRVGAHTKGFNSVSVAISLMGNFMEEKPSDLMLEKTKEMISCGKKLGYITNDAKIHGHRDGRCTSCPGDVLYGIIKKWPNFEGGPLPGYNCDN